MTTKQTSSDQAELTINLDALADNYRLVAKRAAAAKPAAVVKANAYGLGLAQVAGRLLHEGCRHFFVANTEEAVSLRRLTDAADISADIYVLNGLAPEMAEILVAENLRPCLGSPEEITEWRAACDKHGRNLAAAIHIDTGFNRLGLSMADWQNVAAAFDDVFTPALLMSHLACADTPAHEKNKAQLAAFQKITASQPSIPACLANSGGIFLGAEYHFDMVRPGIALYGGSNFATAEDKLAAVVGIEAPILQIRQVKNGETVGYGGDFVAARDSQVAVLAIGYADGFARNLGGGTAVTHVAVKGLKAPVIGRVSMDLIAIDITDCGDGIARGDKVEILGPEIPLGEQALRAQTISYELLTRLGTRLKRVYKQD